MYTQTYQRNHSPAEPVARLCFGFNKLVFE